MNLKKIRRIEYLVGILVWIGIFELIGFIQQLITKTPIIELSTPKLIACLTISSILYFIYLFYAKSRNRYISRVRQYEIAFSSDMSEEDIQKVLDILKTSFEDDSLEYMDTEDL